MVALERRSRDQQEEQVRGEPSATHIVVSASSGILRPCSHRHRKAVCSLGCATNELSRISEAWRNYHNRGEVPSPFVTVMTTEPSPLASGCPPSADILAPESCCN